MSFSEPQPDSEDARYEVFVARFAHYEPDLRRFIRSLLPTWADTDDALQQTAINGCTWPPSLIRKIGRSLTMSMASASHIRRSKINT